MVKKLTYKKIKGISYINLNTKSIKNAMLKYNELSRSERNRIGVKLSNQSKKYYGLSNGPIQYIKLYNKILKNFNVK